MFVEDGVVKSIQIPKELPTARYGHAAVLTSNRTMLITGGKSGGSLIGSYHETAYSFDLSV